MSGEERRCTRCGDEEFRIDGYCTEYCKDMHGVERERDDAKAEVEHLRRGIEAYRAMIGRVTTNSTFSVYIRHTKIEEVRRWEQRDAGRNHHAEDCDMDWDCCCEYQNGMN